MSTSNVQVTNDQEHNTQRGTSGPLIIDFTQPWKQSDIAFKVEGKPIYGNKLILSIWSPVFSAMFESDFLEKAKKEIELPEQNYEDFLELMMVLHPPNKPIDDKNVEKLLAQAHHYQIVDIINRCIKCLIKRTLKVKNMVLAQKYDLPELYADSLKYLKKTKLNALKPQEDFCNVSIEVINEVLIHKVNCWERVYDRSNIY